MARLSARQIALGALRTWRRERRFADSVISRSFAKTDLTKSDRAFALELFYGVLRNLTLLDFWIGCVRASHIDVDLRDILRLGLYQLFFLETAQHAAVFETVALAPKKQRAAINGVLRAAGRRREELLSRGNAQPLFVRTSHPQFLDPKPGEKILDACAAPGGKTGYIAEVMQDHGTIMACDRDLERLETLKHNVARLGAGIIHPVGHDWTRGRLPKEIALVAPFDRILVDAPCSNTGVMRRRVDVRWRLTQADFKRMQTRQLEIVRAALPLLKANGVLVYSTCSLEPEENEHVVRRILAEISSLRLEAERYSLPFRDGFVGAYAAY